MSLPGGSISAQLLSEVDRPDVDQRITFKGLGNCDSTCRVRIWRQSRVVLVVDEGAEEGTSITNGAEHICRHLQEDFEVDLSYAFFELYDEGGISSGPDLVIFKEDPTNNPPLTPAWRPSSIEQVAGAIRNDHDPERDAGDQEDSVGSRVGAGHASVQERNRSLLGGQ